MDQPAPKRIVFLDFDGVLNSERYLEACGDDPTLGASSAPMGIDPAAVAVLNAIVARTGAEVVVSSSWRRQQSLLQLRDALARQGFVGTVLDVTCLRGGLGRAGEIRLWLEEHDVPGFVVLDDLPPSKGLDERWVQTDPREGLDESECERAIELCMRPWTGW